MNKDRVIDSIGRIDDTMIENVENLRQRPRKNRIRMRWAAVVACITVLAISTEISSGLVSNLFAPLYGSAQTDLVNSIGVPIGASTTVEGYTLTADAIIGDRYNVAVVYTLRREDGQPLPDGICFDSCRNTVQTGSGGGSREYRPGKDRSSIQIIETWNGSHRILPRRNAQVRFEDLVCHDKETTQLIAEGVWELNFTVRYQDTTVNLPVNQLEVTGTEGLNYQIQKILLSPIGIHIDLTAPNTIDPDDPTSRVMRDFHVSLMLDDETVIQLTSATRGGSSDFDSEVLDAHYTAMFNQPIPLDTIKALLICDTTYNVQ